MSPNVLSFGGDKSSIVDIKGWMASVTHQAPSVTFDGYLYLAGAPSDGDKAVEGFTKAHDYAAAIKRIEASKSDVIYIVGHSSGRAVGNKVDAGLKEHSKVVLVALDGYAPGNAQLARQSTQVCVAESGTGKSLNHHKMLARIKDYNTKAKDKTQVKVHKASASSIEKLALHFSMVNLSSDDTRVQHIPDGYKDCKANLRWISRVIIRKTERGPGPDLSGVSTGDLSGMFIRRWL